AAPGRRRHRPADLPLIHPRCPARPLTLAARVRPGSLRDPAALPPPSPCACPTRRLARIRMTMSLSAWFRMSHNTLDDGGLFVHAGEYRNMITRMPEWVGLDSTLCRGGAAPH